MNWHRRSTRPIGIDFGSRAIRMLQLAQAGDGLQVAAAEEYVYPADVGDGRRQATLAAVRRMLATGRFAGRRVITALTDADLQMKNLRFPPMPEEELNAAVRFEAAERFGLDASRTEFRHLTAGSIRGGGDAQQEVAVLAAPDEVLGEHLGLLTELGLTAEAVDAEPCAAFRPFERFLRRDADADAVNAFAELGYRGTRVIVSRGRDIIFLKTVDVGGARFDELAAESLQVDATEAGQLRRRMAAAHEETSAGAAADLPASTIETTGTALQPAIDQLGREIGLCLRYCAVTFGGPRCESVTCVGGEARQIELLERLSAAVGVPARKGHPLRGIDCDQVFSTAQQCTGLPEWATAMGLALKPAGGLSARRPG